MSPFLHPRLTHFTLILLWRLFPPRLIKTTSSSCIHRRSGHGEAARPASDSASGGTRDVSVGIVAVQSDGGEVDSVRGFILPPPSFYWDAVSGCDHVKQGVDYTGSYKKRGGGVAKRLASRASEEPQHNGVFRALTAGCRRRLSPLSSQSAIIPRYAHFPSMGCR